VEIRLLAAVAVAAPAAPAATITIPILFVLSFVLRLIYIIHIPPLFILLSFLLLFFNLHPRSLAAASLPSSILFHYIHLLSNFFFFSSLFYLRSFERAMER